MRSILGVTSRSELNRDATAAALSAEWAARCIGGTNGLCDCTRGTASCVEGTCRGTTYDCFAPHDAGVQ